MTIDQTLIPHKEIFIKLRTARQMAEAIKTMKIRGAPLIGAATAYGIALTAFHSRATTRSELMRQLKDSAELLRTTRPTAVNLFWAAGRILKKADATSGAVEHIKNAVVDEANRIADEDVEMNKKIGEHGAKLISDGDVILTHCNAGALATVDYGTAFGVIRTAWEQRKKISVFATETRPKLQGARLTAFELKRQGIPFTLITDNMVGYVMFKGLVNKVIVGADRIVQDAIVNKIGTYSIAVLAHEHKVPFYAAAPSSTFDLAHTSKDVVIEERNPEEVTHIGGQPIAPKGTKAMNPAFDITPMKYVTGVICEKGVFTGKNSSSCA